MSGHPRVITIDGPASAGKTSVAEALAERLGYHVYDTGALYRAATWLALRAGFTAITPDGKDGNGGKDDEAAIVALIHAARIVVSPPKDTVSEPTVTVDGVDVTADLRAPAVNRLVSPVSQLPGVRAALMAVQRQAAADGNVIMVGRDMGTVVVPDADLKLYLTADAAVRAARRTRQLAERGAPRPYDEVLREETERDRIDSGRAVAPLRPAPDAVHIATDNLTINEIVAHALEQVRGKSAVGELAVGSRQSAVGEGQSVAGAGARAGAAKTAATEPAMSAASAAPESKDYPLPTSLDRFARFHKTWAYRAFYRFTTRVLHLAMLPIASITIHGAKHMPKDGPLIVASNHLHNFDPVVIGIALHRNLRPMSKKELWKTRFSGCVVEFYGAFRVNRGKPDRAALRFAEELLKQGEVLFMFPEGSRSTSGKIEQVLPGAAFVAVRTGALILPVGVSGTQSLPLDAKAAKTPHHRGRSHVTVTVGEPFHLTPGPNGKYDMTAATDEIMRHVAALLPPEYRGIYAGAVPPGTDTNTAGETMAGAASAISAAGRPMQDGGE